MAEAFVLVAALVVGALCGVWPAEMPFLLPFVFNPVEFIGFWLVLVWYLRGGGRSAWFLASWAAGYFVLQTHYEYLAQHMFFLNRIQAVTLGMFMPFFVAISRPGEALAAGAPGWARRAARAVWVRLAWVSHPLVAAALLLGTTDFWFRVLDPRAKPPCRYSYLFRAATGFLVMFPQIAVSAYIALTTQDLYPFYSLCGRIFPAISPQYDQMLGGLIQWIPPGMMSTASLLMCLNAVRKTEAEEDKVFVPPPGAKVYEAKWTGRS